MRKENLHHSSYVLFLNLAIISTLLFLLSSFQIITLPKFLPNNLLFGLIFLSLTIGLVNKNKLNELRYHRGSSIKALFEIAPYFFLSLLVVLVINQFLDLEIISNRIFQINTITIFFGFFAFYSNRNRIEKELEDEKQKEEDEEKQRYQDFEYKFPTINRIWGLRSIVRWMYKEGWVYSVGLGLIIFYGLIIRINGLRNYNLWIDEVLSSNAINSILKTGLPILPSGFFYSRDILVHYLLAGAKLITGIDYIQLRLVTILFSIFVVILTYLVAKKISNKKIAILASFMICFLSFEIAWSRQVRFYIFLQFSALLSLFTYLKFKERKNKIRFVTFISSLFLLLFTSVQGILIFPILLLDTIYDRSTREYFISYFGKSKTILFLFILPLLGVFFYTGTIWVGFEIVWSAIKLQTNRTDYYIRAFHNFIPNIYNILLIGTIPLFAIRKKIYRIFTIFFSISLLIAFFLWNSNWLRFLLIAFPLLCINFSILVNIIKNFSKNKVVCYLIILLLLTGSFFRDFSLDPNDIQKLEEPQTNFFLAYNYIYENIDEKDLVISITTGGGPPYFYLKDKFDLERNYVLTLLLNSKDSKEYIEIYKANYDGFNWREGYSNITILNNIDEIKTLMNNSSGYMVYDEQKTNHINEEIIRIFSELDLVEEASDETIKLYRWKSSKK